MAINPAKDILSRLSIPLNSIMSSKIVFLIGLIYKN